ncbi:Ankyrin repeats (3 copies)/Ankyrin repeat [Novymonas esmeraldas]|uniref:Ankyrin repeats (3 copies)/Ankyrin repeat n=1 Tax=Novymonas esmeraldas TaxID=1808958 RepID=A0AAW0ESI7_9TRYP
MDSTELMRALLSGSEAEIAKAVEDKAFLRLCNQPLPNGQYPLHAVASRKRAEAVEALLQAGVNVNQESEEPGNSLGFTAAHYAAVGNAVPVLEVLKRHGADMDHAAADQWTPLHAATFRGQSAAVAALVGLGANVDCPTAEGHTPLVFAVNLGRVKDVRFLLQSSASIQFNDARNDSLLHYALHYRIAQSVKGEYKLPDSQLDVAVLLVLNGVRPDVRNDDGDAATRYAAATLPSLPAALSLIFDDAIKLLCAPTELNYLTLASATTAFLVDKVSLAPAQAQTLVDAMAALEKERQAARPKPAVAAAAAPGASAPPSMPTGHPTVPAEMLDLHGGDPSNGQCPFLARAAKQQANKRAATAAAAEDDRPHCPFSLYTMRRNKGTALLVAAAFFLGYCVGQRQRAV